jgi:hypothetical protein
MNKSITLEVFRKRRKSEWHEHIDAVEQRTQDDFQVPHFIGGGGADLDCHCGPDDPPLQPVPNTRCGDDFNREVPAGENQWGMASQMNGGVWDVNLMGYINGVNFSAVDGGRGYWHITNAPDGGSFDNANIVADQWSGIYPLEIEVRWRGTNNTPIFGGIRFASFALTGGMASVTVNNSIVASPLGPSLDESTLTAIVSDGVNSVSVDSQMLTAWHAQNLHFKLKVIPPDTVAIKYWLSGAPEPDYMVATDALVVFNPTLLTEMNIQSHRPSQGSGINESADVFYLDYIDILSGYECGLMPGAWLLYDWAGIFNGIIDPAGNIQNQNSLQDAYTIRALTKEIGDTNTYELPSKAEYIMDVWFDGLHATPEEEWTFIAPRTIEVIPHLANNVQIEALYVSKF